MSKKVIVNGLNIGYLPPTNASEINYTRGGVTTTVEDAIDGLNDNKVSKSGDTMTGDLYIDQHDGSTTVNGSSELVLGNNIASGIDGNSRGMIYLYSTSDKYVRLAAPSLTDNRNIDFPNNGGTLAISSSHAKLNVREIGTNVSSVDITIASDRIATVNMVNGLLFSRPWLDPDHPSSNPLTGALYWVCIRPHNQTVGFYPIKTETSSTYSQVNVSSMSYNSTTSVLTINFTGSGTRFIEFMYG